MSIDKGSAGASRGEYVHARLYEAIRDGRFPPGSRIREAEVATWLGVSRTPVREALRRLQSDGLLVFEPWRGVIVAELSHAQVIELYAMRRVLEGAAARLAAQHAASSEVDAMADIMARATATDSEDSDTLAALNRDFHQALYHAAHNRYLLKSLNALRDSLALLKSTTYAIPGRAAAAQGEHQALMDALRARDPDAAERAAFHHIEAAERVRLRLLTENP